MAHYSNPYNLSCALANGEIAGDGLESITNPLGGSIDLTYGNSSGLLNNRMPFILHPVKTIEAYDGIIDDINNNIDIPVVTTYDYANGYYDYADRESRGFGYVKQTNPDNTTIETTYEITNKFKKGRPLTEVMKDASLGTTLMITNNNWSTYPTNPTTWAFVKLASKLTTYENNSAYSTAEAYGYNDTNGFPVTVVKSGTNANGQAIEQVTQSYTYDKYPSTSWTWRLKQETITGSTTGLARKMTYNYDNKGNMTSKTFWRTSSLAYNSIDYGYDAYGNVISEVDALEHPPTTIAYDTTFTFPVTITNPKNHVTTKTWNYRFGKEHLVTDPNGNKTFYSYDDFGRNISITNTNASDNMVGYSATDYTHFDGTNFPRYITTKVLESGSIGSGSYVAKEEYYDGLGRTIKVATDGIDDQEPPQIRRIFTTTHYDNMGRKSEAYGPFFNGEAENSRYYEKTYYDKMGRVDYIESPSGVSTDPAIIDYNYPNYFTTVITDPDNKQKTERRDHLGRIFEVIEHADLGNQSTFYWYNAASDMLEVENALGYSTLITYDARGLKLTMDDPDMGYWTYTYDENGNLSTQTDAKSQVITFTYELLNRVSQKTYTPSENNPTVTYTYDNAINGKGQLYSVTNSNVTTTFNEYDEMGRVVSVTKTITGDQPRTTETDYDLSGKVLNITHPDGLEVRNTYYPGTNLLNTVKGTFDDVTIKEYAKCTEYEPTGKIGRIYHAYNDTETVYTYDLQTTRLMDLLTTGQSGDIQHKSYDYSDAGDLLTITDYSGPTPVTYTYEYDNLHRLLSEDVTGDYLPPTTYEALIFTYNDPDHINAVSSISYNGTPYAFSYDANGNMTSGYDFTNPASIATRSLTWNADNMPLTVSRNGTVTTTLTYDGNGARAKKVAGGTTTYYVSNDYEIKNGVATKYVFAGNMRVASIEGTNINNSKIFHKDHLGSSTAITDSTGADTETTEYMPFGVQRSHSGANASDYKYTDQELDNESGLYNYDARMYDPVIGRFISADTIAQSPYNPQSLNRYSYCMNNPLNYVDPSGHVAIPGPKLDEFRKGFNETSREVVDPYYTYVWSPIRAAMSSLNQTLGGNVEFGNGDGARGPSRSDLRVLGRANEAFTKLVNDFPWIRSVLDMKGVELTRRETHLNYRERMIMLNPNSLGHDYISDKRGGISRFNLHRLLMHECCEALSIVQYFQTGYMANHADIFTMENSYLDQVNYGGRDRLPGVDQRTGESDSILSDRRIAGYNNAWNYYNGFWR